ncbi:MAG: hypothetical protein FD181_2664 [Prolixibacteraceae bacterium]|nr:MAG: hypothetical protein FD181_2664 [Prolixibacteraceae bacterium]
MNATDMKINRNLQILSWFTFLALSTIYFYWFAGYIFFYQEKSSLFLLSFSYFAEHLSQPGGFLVWLAELQTAFYFYPLAGAFIVSIEICICIFIITKIGKVLTRNTFFLIPFLTGAILFYLQANYQYKALNNLGILMQLLVFYLVIRFLAGKWMWVPVSLFPVWYFLTGSFSTLFLILVAFYLILSAEKGKWSKLIVLYVVGAIFFYVAQEFLFFQTIESLLVYPFSEQNIGNQKPLFITVIAIISMLPLIFRFHLKLFFKIEIRRFQIRQITPFLVMAVFAYLAVSRIDKKNSHYFHVEKLFYEKKFDELINYNRQFPSINILTNYLNNIALAETGKLNDMLFQFQQSPDGGTLFLKWELAGEVLKRGGYFYWSLGMINEAQRWPYEFMVMRGNTPEGLKMLIKTDLASGNYNVAQKYISILKQSVFYRREARKFEKLLFDDTAIEKDAELGAKRRLKTKHDFFVLAENPAANLDLIIAADSANRIAAEYKFAWLLLQKDFEGVTKLLPLLKSAGFERIPKNIEEAVVAYSLLNLKKYPEFEGFEINPQTVIRFNEYYGIFQQNRGNKQQAQAALRDYSDTYWYHVVFR